MVKQVDAKESLTPGHNKKKNTERHQGSNVLGDLI